MQNKQFHIGDGDRIAGDKVEGHKFIVDVKDYFCQFCGDHVLAEDSFKCTGCGKVFCKVHKTELYLCLDCTELRSKISSRLHGMTEYEKEELLNIFYKKDEPRYNDASQRTGEYEPNNYDVLEYLVKNSLQQLKEALGELDSKNSEAPPSMDGVLRQDILKAIDKYDVDFPNNDYDHWLGKHIYKYALEYKGRLYPPKYIMSLVIGIPTTRFYGGKDKVNRCFERQGFNIIPKPIR